MFYFYSGFVLFDFRIDDLTVEEMKEMLSVLLRLSVKLAGISNVLEVLESSFKVSDLHQLQESVLKTKQV